METLKTLLQSCLVDNDDDKANKSESLKHSSSAPVIDPKKSLTNVSTASDDQDVDDDIWCNVEDEENLRDFIKFDQEKEKEMRNYLGDDTFKIVRDALEVNI